MDHVDRLPTHEAFKARKRRVDKLLDASRKAYKSGKHKLLDDIMAALLNFEVRHGLGKDPIWEDLTVPPRDTASGSSSSSTKAAASAPSQPSPSSAGAVGSGFSHKVATVQDQPKLAKPDRMPDARPGDWNAGDLAMLVDLTNPQWGIGTDEKGNIKYLSLIHI